MCAKSLRSHPPLCDPMNGSPPGSSVHGILQAKYWSWLPCAPSGDLPNPGAELTSLASPALAGRFFTASATREASRLDSANLLLEVKSRLPLPGGVWESTQDAGSALYLDPGGGFLGKIMCKNSSTYILYDFYVHYTTTF